MLAEHAQQPPEAPTARGLRSQIRVQGIARQQQPPAVTGEFLLTKPSRRQQEGPGEGQADRPAQPQREAGTRLERRKGGEERVQEVSADLGPCAAHPRPGRSIPGGEGVQTIGGRFS